MYFYFGLQHFFEIRIAILANEDYGRRFCFYQVVIRICKWEWGISKYKGGPLWRRW